MIQLDFAFGFRMLVWPRFRVRFKNSWDVAFSQIFAHFELDLKPRVQIQILKSHLVFCRKEQPILVLVSADAPGPSPTSPVRRVVGVINGGPRLLGTSTSMFNLK